MSQPAGVLTVSVVVCTRDRPDDAERAVRSILDAVPDIRPVVVDQSDGPSTRTRLCPFGERVIVVEAPPRGLAAARNVGVLACDGDVIAFTDDDCEAGRGWATALRDTIAASDRIGMAFGCVLPPDYDRDLGFVPAYRVRAPFVATHLSEKHRIEGMGACMAVRRTTFEALGGFDEALGSGAPLRAGEDTDFAVRALATGWHVAETPAASVIHHGFRTWAQGPDLIAGYMVGLGATNMKMLRLGGVRALRPLGALAWRWFAGTPVVDLNRRPPRLTRLAAFLRGAGQGLRRRLDASGRFAGREERATVARDAPGR
jgi:hypothetical protein